MVSDIELDGDRVRVTDGILDIDENWGMSVGDDTRIRSNRIRTGRVLSEEIRSGDVRASEVEIGTASPSEPAAAGTAWVVDRHGADRIYLNGGEGVAESRDNADDSETDNDSTGGVPWRFGGGWRTIRIPRFPGTSIPDGALDSLTGEQDERAEAPDTVRVYIEGDAGSIGLGGDGVDGDLVVTNGDGETVVHIDGDTGDIKLEGLDKPVGETIAELQAEITDLREQL